MTAAGVLIVEDDPDLRKMLSDFLREEGYTVYEAESGKLALEHLRTQPERLVVLLDLLMGEMSGFPILRAVAAEASPLTKHTYIILTAATRKSIPPDVEAIIQELKILFVQKPFDLDELLAAIQKATSTLH